MFGAWVDTFDFGSGIFGLRGCYRTGSPPFESAMRRKLCHYAHDWRALGALSLERKPNASSSGLGSSGSSANAPCQTGQECYQSSARARAPPPDRGVCRSETLAPSSAPCTSTSIPAGNAEGALLFAGRRSKQGRRTARGPVCQPLLQQPVLCQQPFRLHSSTFAHVPFDLVGQALAGTSRARASIVTVRPRSLEFVAWVAPLQAAESCRHGGRMSGRVRHRLAGFRIAVFPFHAVTRKHSPTRTGPSSGESSATPANAELARFRARELSRSNRVGERASKTGCFRPTAGKPRQFSNRYLNSGAGRRLLDEPCACNCQSRAARNCVLCRNNSW